MAVIESKPHHRNNKLSVGDRAVIRTALNIGWSTVDLAKFYRVSRWTIWRQR